MELVLPKTFSLKDALLAQENRKIKMRFWDLKEDWTTIGTSLDKCFSYPVRYIQMPSLGMEDKTGKDYFEGDILEYGSYIPSGTKKSKPCLYVLICSPESKQTTLKPLQNVVFSPFDIKDGKIVGNIYQNPKLFTDGK